MTPTYTPDDIELWRELRAAFDFYVTSELGWTPHFCNISQSFEKAWDAHRGALKALVLEFLKAHTEFPVQPGNNFLFTSTSTQLAVQARSLFIDWNIERLTPAKTFPTLLIY